MYSYFTGNLQEIFDHYLVLDVNHIGYQVFISRKDYDYFQPYIGQQITIYIYLNVKEDSHTLYGFSSRQTKEIFNILLSISGIGPKSAINILSELSVDQLISAVLTNDLFPLTSVSGVGKKTAERMILELKDKFKNMEVPGGAADNLLQRVPGHITQEAADALATLGFNPAEIKRTLQAIRSQLTKEMTVEQIVTLALRSKSNL